MSFVLCHPTGTMASRRRVAFDRSGQVFPPYRAEVWVLPRAEEGRITSEIECLAAPMAYDVKDDPDVGRSSLRSASNSDLAFPVEFMEKRVSLLIFEE
jgi:hypothetical protein